MPANPTSLEQAIALMLLALLLFIHAGGARRLALLIVLAAVALSLIRPLFRWEASWSVVSIVVLPVLLWQVGIDMAAVATFDKPTAWAIWLGTVLAAAGIAAVTDLLPPSGAIVAGLLIATLLRGIRGSGQRYGAIGAAGLLVAAVLLTEVDLDLHPATRWIGSPFSGGGLGLLIGFAAVRLARRLGSAVSRDIVLVGSAYVAYLAEAMQRSSGVSAALMAGLMSGAYGYHLGIWACPEHLPSLPGRPGVLAILGGFTLWLGWQTHANLELARILTIPLALGVGLLAWALMHLAGGHLRTRTSALRSSGHQIAAVLVLLGGAGLWWPRTPAPSWPVLLTALGAAAVALTLAYVIPYRLAEQLDIPLRRPGSEAADEAQPSKGGGDSWLNW